MQKTRVLRKRGGVGEGYSSKVPHCLQIYNTHRSNMIAGEQGYVISRAKLSPNLLSSPKLKKNSTRRWQKGHLACSPANFRVQWPVSIFRGTQTGGFEKIFVPRGRKISCGFPIYKTTVRQREKTIGDGACRRSKAFQSAPMRHTTRRTGVFASIFHNRGFFFLATISSHFWRLPLLCSIF